MLLRRGSGGGDRRGLYKEGPLLQGSGGPSNLPPDDTPPRDRTRGARLRRTDEKLVSELMQMLGQLDGIMIDQLRNQPELQGAWASARNVAWPAPQEKTEAATRKGEPAA